MNWRLDGEMDIKNKNSLLCGFSSVQYGQNGCVRGDAMKDGGERVMEEYTVGKGM